MIAQETIDEAVRRLFSTIEFTLLNKSVGDVVEVRVPAGLIRLRIDTIE